MQCRKIQDLEKCRHKIKHTGIKWQKTRHRHRSGVPMTTNSSQWTVKKYSAAVGKCCFSRITKENKEQVFNLCKTSYIVSLDVIWSCRPVKSKVHKCVNKHKKVLKWILERGRKHPYQHHTPPGKGLQMLTTHSNTHPAPDWSCQPQDLEQWWKDGRMNLPPLLQVLKLVASGWCWVGVTVTDKRTNLVSLDKRERG